MKVKKHELLKQKKKNLMRKTTEELLRKQTFKESTGTLKTPFKKRKKKLRKIKKAHQIFE